MSKSEIEQAVNQLQELRLDMEEPSRAELLLRYDSPEELDKIEIELYGKVQHTLCYATDSEVQRAVKALISRGELE